jgi:hypothetical protein
MNKLDSVFINHAYDFFCRMGGSGRYREYREWHPIGLVLMIATGVKPPQSPDWDKVYDGSNYLPASAWRKTDIMPYRVFEKIKEIEITSQMFYEFIELSKLRLKGSIADGEKEVEELNGFIAEQQKYFDDFFEIKIKNG